MLLRTTLVSNGLNRANAGVYLDELLTPELRQFYNPEGIVAARRWWISTQVTSRVAFTRCGIISWNFLRDTPDFEFSDWNCSNTTEEDYSWLVARIHTKQRDIYVAD